MKVRIDLDELYPYYFETDDDYFGTVIELTEEEYVLFKQVDKKFFEVQRLIEKKVNKKKRG